MVTVLIITNIVLILAIAFGGYMVFGFLSAEKGKTNSYLVDVEEIATDLKELNELVKSNKINIDFTPIAKTLELQAEAINDLKSGVFENKTIIESGDDGIIGELENLQANQKLIISKFDELQAYWNGLKLQVDNGN